MSFSRLWFVTTQLYGFQFISPSVIISKFPPHSERVVLQPGDGPQRAICSYTVQPLQPKSAPTSGLTVVDDFGQETDSLALLRPLTTKLRLQNDSFVIL
jgi:hypothetical protein